MNPLDIFLDFFRQSLTLVNNEYYRVHGWNESMLNAHLGEVRDEERESLQKYLDGYGERVFCYELYHQVRSLMDNFSLENPETFREVKLQCELKKDFIGEIIHLFRNVQSLDSEFMPDFLLHSPRNFDSQFLIVEVKSNPNLSFSGMKEDLLKIQQFINRYLYEKGVFLTVNTDPERISAHLNREASINWLRENINTPDKVHIMCKMKNDVEIFERTIEQIIN